MIIVAVNRSNMIARPPSTVVGTVGPVVAVGLIVTHPYAHSAVVSVSVASYGAADQQEREQTDH